MAERREEPAFDARQGEERHEDEADDDRGVDDAGAHLVRGVDDHREGRAGRALRPVVAQAPQDVLHIDDGIVHEFADGDGETAERHRVDGETQQREHRGGRENRDGDGGERDQRGPQVHEEGEQHHRHHGHGLDQHRDHVAKRRLDEIRLAEQDVAGLDPVRQGGADFLERRLDLAGQTHGVDARLLLDGNHHRGIAHETAIAALGPRPEGDLGDLPQVDRPVRGRHDETAQVVEIGGAAERADQDLATPGLGIAAAGIAAVILEGAGEGLVGDAQRPHGGGIGGDPELAHLAADGDHLRHARDREQARAQGEVGGLAHLHRGRGLRGDGDQQDAAHDRGDRPPSAESRSAAAPNARAPAFH